MHIRLLGTAAGGGFPQWNCNCQCCAIARRDPSRAKPRTQSSVAVSGDGKRWLLLNASPDVRAQIESFPALLPTSEEVRGTSIAGVCLTDADLDHTLGLLILREGPPLTVYATKYVEAALREQLNLGSVLSNYAGIEWREPNGEVAGLRFSAFAVPGSGPRYARTLSQEPAVVGYRFVDSSTQGRLVYIPHIAAFDDAVMSQLRECDVLLIDGTCWSDDEIPSCGVSQTTAREMGHLPVGGEDGSLRFTASLPIKRRIYVHLNNTNPMLLEDSLERREVEDAGAEIGFDGMNIQI
jgi:pyrroloquinoline quinone biosynthesis protein B